MRILFSGQSYYRKDNGQAVFMIRLAEGLVAAGHDVMALAPSEKGISERTNVRGVIVQTVPALHIGHNLNITAFNDSQVDATLAEFRPDVVHIQDHFFLNRTVLRLARRRRIRVVGTNHFLPANWSNNMFIPRSVQGVVHKAMWYNMLEVFNQLDAATTPTETAVAILRKQDIHIPVKAISCGVDQDEFYPRPGIDPAVMRRRFRIATDRTVLLYVGRIDREKGLDDVVEAADERADQERAGLGDHEGLERLEAECHVGLDADHHRRQGVHRQRRDRAVAGQQPGGAGQLHQVGVHRRSQVGLLARQPDLGRRGRCERAHPRAP